MLSSLKNGLRHSGYEPGARIIVALSGGPDSTALTLGLTELLDERDQVVAAHFNHRTRGEASDADEQFVRELCTQLGIELRIGHAPEQTDWMSEADARELRYDFLQRAAADLDVQFVAVAHTADDQAETVLLRIARGTGMRGLAAMPYARPIAAGSQVQLIRPLLEASRAEVNEYLSGRGITPRHDASNDDVHYARNRIRHQVMPALAEINPAVVPAINRLAKIAREHNDFIDAELDIVAQRVDNLNLNGIQDLATPLAARLLEKMHAEVAEPGAQIEMNHIEAVLQLVKRPTEAELHLPGNVILRHSAGETTLSRRDGADATEAVPFEEAKLPIPGSVVLSTGARMTAEIVEVPESFADAQQSGHRYVYVTRDLARDGYLTIRGRHTSDRYSPIGTRHRRKLQDMMVNAKVPRSQRDSVPIVIGRFGQIAWVVGFPPSDFERVRELDTTCVKLEFHEPADS